ncbi:MAG: hypothetical protein UY92_C0004G0038 [Candidatus Magasanikbacteria bacterium GW2011_GWA2_56_11]|uniref:DNA alkylation repair protein n=1 Tax=Candidatus Magasanikbacteria bacterium GW2011_GWA2_56_11 TaxID=1619044 RepID=A0A0G2AN04_9BACT|nr:MAG: hypothetical protein UY92_C0004G0038 [Candidatus Magasanikbacteria bacterium GW2011_GWA2_56_11]
MTAASSTKTTAGAVRRALRADAQPERARTNAWFFKTGRGEYGEHDKFIGVANPDMRRVAREYRDLPLEEIESLLHSPWHEERQTALFILTLQFARAGRRTRREIYRFYLANTAWINNWDLVDCSAYKILGPYLADKPAAVLTRLARSKNLWERRLAIVATLAFIVERRFEQTLKLAVILLHDEHDLLHKAVGWMLREVGKQDRRELRNFLDTHAGQMPRTMLRYAIEKFPDKERRKYLSR